MAVKLPIFGWRLHMLGGLFGDIDLKLQIAAIKIAVNVGFGKVNQLFV